jgi:hypothetical protein
MDDFAEENDLNSEPDTALSLDVASLVDGLDDQKPGIHKEPPPPPENVKAILDEKDAESDSASTNLQGKTGDLLDALGNAFNPDEHATKNGEPVKRKDGSFAKKRGRKSGAKKPVEENTSGFVKTPPKMDPDAQAKQVAENNAQIEDAKNRAALYAAMGTNLANLTVAGGVVLGGEDFVATEKEIAAMAGGYTTYLQARNINVEASPEFVLAGTLAAYVVPRMAKPKVKERAASWFLKTKIWFGKLFSKQRAAKVEKEIAVEEKRAPTPAEMYGY